MSGDNGELNGSDVIDSPEDITEAKAIGWLPAEEYKAAGKRGEPISAKEFLDRGHAIMPFLKKDNEKLGAENRRLNAQMVETQRQLREASEQMENLETYHQELRKSDRERITKELRVELAQAMKDGDAEAVADITAEIAENASGKGGGEAKGGGKGSGPAPINPELDPVFVNWRAANPWVDSDEDKTRYSTGVFYSMRQKYPGVFGKPFFDLVDAEMAKYQPKAAPRSKVDGSGAGSGSGGSSDGKSFSDLPPEARAKCDDFGKRFVKKDGKYPTLASWRQKYCADYFRE